MALTMRERHAVIKELSRGYLKCSKLERGKILTEAVELTGYRRDYAALLLRGYGKGIVYGPTGILLKPSVKRTRNRKAYYDERVHKALKKVWAIYDCPCGKRLAPVLPEMVRVLERENELEIDTTIREKLAHISAATIDRLLVNDKRHLQIRGRTYTTAGSMLKQHIPIRTFADWDEQRPGYLEIDLVGHDGGNSRGDFSFTLTATDIYSGWTEVRIVRNKAQKWVFQQLLDIRSHLPFPVLGIDSDNGSEFLNDHLYRYCKDEQIDFTRSRAQRKNDNCFVEQKNNQVVRRAVGYLRYDTDEARAIIRSIYTALNLSVNYFYPTQKLESKTREGAKLSRKYDTPATPCQRLIRCDMIPALTKKQLAETYETLNPARLKREITRLQQKLWRRASQNAGEQSA